MKRACFLFILILCLTLTGCSWFDGSYVSVNPHWEPHQAAQSDVLSASDYPSLMKALKEMISKGTASAPIVVADYTIGSVDRGMTAAIEFMKTVDPIGAYAVEDITYEQGTSGGLAALAVNVTYRHSFAEIQRVRTVTNVSQAEELVAEALETCATGVVIHVKDYSVTDFAQVVQDYATLHPELVMEVPQVTEVLYGSGRPRVVEPDLQLPDQPGRSAADEKPGRAGVRGGVSVCQRRRLPAAEICPAVQLPDGAVRL